jgi:hypothetical protein
VNNPCRWLGILVILGCSNLSESNGGIVALGLRLPSPAAVEPDDTLALIGYALDVNGDTVNTPVYWRTLDDTLLTIVDSTGLVTTSKTTGRPRVQARVGSLRSEIVQLTIRPKSDTLRLTGTDIITVPAGDSLSDTLGVVVESQNPAGGVLGTSIRYEVTEPDSGLGRVRFPNGLLAYRVTTGSNGAPATAVTLRKLTGATPPAVLRVRVSAQRPSGRAVPGSGQQFTLLFQ